MHKKQYPNGTKEIKEIVQAIKCLQRNQLILYLSKLKPQMQIQEIEQLIQKLVNEQVIFSIGDKYVGSIPTLEADLKNALFFWLYLEMVDDAYLDVSAAKYPADFIVEKDNKLYEILIYDEGGPAKLNFLAHKRTIIHDTIILIVLINENEEIVPTSYRPREAHQFVTLQFSERRSDRPNILYSNLYEKVSEDEIS